MSFPRKRESINIKKLLELPVFRQQNRIFALVFLGIAILFLAGSYFRLLENSELGSLDLRFRLRPAIPVTDKVAIIEIGDDTIQKIGRFPFDRRYHALLTKVLAEYGAKSVMYDIFFSEADKGDPEFQEAIQQAGNVYLPYVFDLGKGPKQKMPQAQGFAAQNLDYFQKASAGQGHINLIPDSDGKYRRVPLLVKYKTAMSPYLSLRLVSDYLGFSGQSIEFKPGQYIKLGGKIKVPLDEDSNMIVNFAGPWGKFYKHYSYVDVLRSYADLQTKEKPILDLNVFKGKICLIGLTATGTTDLHPNPFAALYPALSIHADLINSILNHRFITRMSRVSNMIILFLLGGLLSWAVWTSKPFKGFLLFSGLFISYAVLTITVFSLFGWWIDMAYPLMALLAIYLISALMISVREWKKKLFMDNELQIARKIQESFLPKSLPATEGLDVAALMHTARRVGGDLYDFYEFEPNRLGVMIGDVSGKGIPASLFMTTVSGAFKFFALPEVHPQEALHRLNVKLTRESSTKLFVTMFYAIFDIKNRVMSYANGGHQPVMHFPLDAPVKFLDVEDGYPLGLLDSDYSGDQVSFSSGDVFIFFTDGVTEARNMKANLYGNERFASVVEKNRSATAKEILKAIEVDLRAFEPEYKQSDDITCIVLKVS